MSGQQFYTTGFCYCLDHVTTGEEQHCGGVALPVFRRYMTACGGSTPCLLILALFVLNVGSSAFCQWWLSYWINQGSGVRLLILHFLTHPPLGSS